MAIRTYTADELAAMTPAEDQALFDARVVTDPDRISAHLEGLRARFLAQLAEQEAHDRA